jgi:hypothetical protein
MTLPDRFTPASLLDLRRYPITDRASPVYADLVATCRAQLQAIGACELPGFLTEEATAAMAAESERLAPLGYHSIVEGNAYLEPIDPALPAEHPKRMTETTALAAVAYDQFPADSLIRQLYEWEPLMVFLADALGKERLYRYADPMGALNLSVMKKGDYLRWHFDQTDFVTSLALQSPTSGGVFEFVPMIRTPQEERFEAVRALLRGARQDVRTIDVTPGTLALFHGRYSIHRVTEIEGDVLRHMALFGYDTQPGVKSSEHLQYIRYGRTSAPKES